MKIVTLCAIAATMAGSALLSTGAIAQATSPDTSVSQPADPATPVKAKAKKKQHVAAASKKKKKTSKKPAADTQMDSSPMSSPNAAAPAPASGGGM
jgi:hypothetical protein